MLERRRTDMSVSRDRRNDGSDRRIAPRYAAGWTTVVLCWSEDDDYRTVAAILRDISMGGGSALAEEAPAVGSSVWFRLRSDDTTPWLGATVIGVSKTRLLLPGPRLIRWRFREPCPYQVFKSAIDGFSLEAGSPDQTVPGYNYRDWR